MAQIEPPKPLQPFPLPLESGTTAQAMILPTQGTTAYLVYATPTGQIVSYQMTPMNAGTNPSPTPTPTPTPTPDTTHLNLITITATGFATITPAVQAKLDATNSTFHAFNVAEVADDNPPDNALLWIGRSAGKEYPYTFLAASDGTTLWQGPTPKTDADFLAIFTKAKRRTLKKACDANGRCPCERSR